MNLISVSAFVSTALGVYCGIPYIWSILKGKTKPHQLSWLVFVIMNGIVLLSQFLSGGRASILITLTFFVGSFINFLLSLKFGIRESSKWDKALFIFALTTIAVWIFTKNNALAIWLTVFIDFTATTMIILKIKSDPHSEDAQPWMIAAVAYIFSILTLVGQPVSILYVRPLYGLLGDMGIVVAIYWYKRKSVKKEQISPEEI